MFYVQYLVENSSPVFWVTIKKFSNLESAYSFIRYRRNRLKKLGLPQNFIYRVWCPHLQKNGGGFF